MSESNLSLTETVKARFHLATVPDDIDPELNRRVKAGNDAEFEGWLAELKEELRAEIRQEDAEKTAQQKSAQRSLGAAAEPGSVSDIYARSPYASILFEALDHRPGELTSDDFKRGYVASTVVTHIRGAAALEAFGIPEENAGDRELVAAIAGDRGLSSVQADSLADELIDLGFSRSSDENPAGA